MRVAVDLQSVEGKKTGIGVAAANLLGALRLAAPDIRLLAYSKNASRDLNTPGRILWESAEIPLRVLRDRPDLVYSPGFAPAFLSPRPQVVTVHDLIGMIHPENLPPAARFYWSRWLPACVRRARAVVASSESTRRDLVRLLKMDEKKIRLVPCGGGEAFYPEKDAAASARVKARHGLGAPYFITVGTLEPRKNIPNLLKALRLALDKRKDAFELVLAGKDGSELARIQALTAELGLGTKVKILGYVPDGELRALYSGSIGYAFVSTYEGFGLPVLEAMRCARSGVCTSVSSPPEIAGDTALYADPSNPADIADKLLFFAQDTALRERLSQAAHERSRLFTWEKAAHEMADVFRANV